MSDVFDTYVRNADEFYTRLYNDEEYRKEILETTKNLLPSYGELKKYYSEVTLEQFWEDLKYAFGKPPSSNEGSLVYNVKINLNLISDQDYCSVLVERIAALEQEALSAEKNILEHTDKVLS